MPAYNFQKQFVPKILDKSKPHTIRQKRKRPTKVGDMLMLYTGMRTKSCELIVISECIKVEPINIYPGRMVILNGVNNLSQEEINNLAIADGFINAAKFFDFFEYMYGLPTFNLELIHWDTGDLFMPVMGQPAGEVRLQLGGDHPHPALSLKGEEKSGAR